MSNAIDSLLRQVILMAWVEKREKIPVGMPTSTLKISKVPDYLLRSHQCVGMDITIAREIMIANVTVVIIVLA